jgi:predicted transcriptional regulator
VNEGSNQSRLTELVATIVTAYVRQHNVSPSELSEMIASFHAALAGLGKPAEPEPVTYTPAVQVRKSITSDHIISLIDGKGYKSLKRHLSGRGLTPDQYRQRYGLPRNYPMVAANYAAKRSELARSIGLGRARGKKG